MRGKQIDSCCGQHGTSLLEVLIAVVILSIGMLGLAGLQLTGLRVNQGAMQRSQASVLAYDILDRMRGDKEVANGGEYDVVVVDEEESITTTMSAALIAAKKNENLSQWGAAIRDSLPGGAAMICRTDNPALAVCTGSGDNFIVRIDWADENDRSGTVQSVTVMGQL